MSARRGDPFDIAPKRSSSAALLLIDVINELDLEGGNELFANAEKIIEPLASLRLRAKECGMPVIYVNCIFTDFKNGIDHAQAVMARSPQAARIIGPLFPEPDDLHIVKNQRSGFYGTSLAVTLLELNVSELIIAGFTTDICVLFTAHDGFVRGYRIHVPQDCSAAAETRYHTEALQFLERVAEADTTPASEIDLNKFCESPAETP